MSDISKTNCASDVDLYLVNFFKKDVAVTSPVVKFRNLSLSNLNDLQYTINTYSISDVHDSGYINSSDLNLLYYIAGSTTRAMLNRASNCEECRNILNMSMSNEENTVFSKYTKISDLGGLKHPCKETFTIILNCEIIFRHLKSFILHNSFKVVGELVANKLTLSFNETCKFGCNLKLLIVEHFYKVRGYTYISKFSCNKKKKMYGSASNKKKKV